MSSDRARTRKTRSLIKRACKEARYFRSVAKGRSQELSMAGFLDDLADMLEYYMRLNHRNKLRKR